MNATDRERLLARFWAKVNKTGESPGACWLWTGTKNTAGYGVLHVGGGKVMAHRFTYELLREPIPVGLVIDHLCRMTSCVNPTHLEAVTNRVNVLRGIGPSAMAAVATHCPTGHAYEAENVCLKATGERKCRTCARSYYHRNRNRYLGRPHRSLAFIERAAERGAGKSKEE